MPRKHVAAALEARGEALAATASLDDMQQHLIACLLRERQFVPSPDSRLSIPEARTECVPGAVIPEHAVVPGQHLASSVRPGGMHAGESTAGTLVEVPVLSDMTWDTFGAAVCHCSYPQFNMVLPQLA